MAAYTHYTMFFHKSVYCLLAFQEMIEIWQFSVTTCHHSVLLTSLQFSSDHIKYPSHAEKLYIVFYSSLQMDQWTNFKIILLSIQSVNMTCFCK